MTVDVSRAQFEAWYQTAGISHWKIRFHREEDGKYTFVGTENAWQTWQASRGAIEIILPKASVYQTNEAASQADYYFDCGQADGLSKAKIAIEAAGLEVKP